MDEIEFKEIFKLKNRGFGIDCDGRWCTILSNGTTIYADDSHNCMFYLICLEKNIKELKSDLSKFQQGKNFPFFFIVLCGLTSPFGHWVEKALDWLSEMKLRTEERKIIKEQLKLIMENKNHSQRIRHKAKKISYNL